MWFTQNQMFFPIAPYSELYFLARNWSIELRITIIYNRGFFQKLLSLRYFTKAATSRCYVKNQCLGVLAWEFVVLEAATKGVLSKKLFLKIPQNSKKNTCASLFSNKVAKNSYSNFLNKVEKQILAQVFSCEFCEIFKNTFFTEHLWATISEVLWIVQPQLRKRDVIWLQRYTSKFRCSVKNMDHSLGY